MHRTKPLPGSRRAEATARARALLAQGDFDEGVRVCLDSEAFEEAAEIRRSQGRPAEAARLYLLALGTGLADLPRLDPSWRTLAASAAECFVSAGETKWAAQIRAALGDADPAPDLLPLIREAARQADTLDRPLEAARMLEAGGAFAEAALAYLSAGDRARSLAALTRISPTSPQYRSACVRAVALASEDNAFSVVIEQFLSHFVRDGPQSALELQAFFRLALLYESNGLLGNAVEALHKLLAIRSDYPQATQALARTEAKRLEPRPGAASILAEEASFLGGTRRPRTTPSGRSMPSPSPTVPVPAPEILGPFVEGALIADRYRIGKVIGRGGMSLVFDAHDHEQHIEVALKVFVHPVQTDEAIARFRQEMEVSRRIAHQNVLKLHDLGTFQGYRFVSMERLRGADLRQRMSPRLDLETALECLIQTCHGLQAAHALGVVHRDIKPENLFLTDSRLLKIMDFGIAKVMSAPNITLGGVIWGTPRYMSPEQIDDFSRATAQSDLYSLGVVAYELLVGHPPFDHSELTELLLMHLRRAPLPPRELRPALPQALDELILALLAKRPSERPSSAAECAARLEAVIGKTG